MYVAENYYKGISDESIMYEKDGVISKIKQFDYKVNKLIKKSTHGEIRSDLDDPAADS